MNSRSTSKAVRHLAAAIVLAGTIACGGGGGPSVPSATQTDCFTATPSHLDAGSNFQSFDLSVPVTLTQGAVNVIIGSNIPLPDPKIQRAVMTLEGNLPCPQAITLTLSLPGGRTLTLWNGQGPCVQAGQNMPPTSTWIAATEVPDLVNQSITFPYVATLKSDGRKENLPAARGGCPNAGLVGACLGNVKLTLSIDYVSYGPPFKC